VEIYEEHIQVTTHQPQFIKQQAKKKNTMFFLLQQWCFLLCFLPLSTLPFLQLPTVAEEEYQTQALAEE
jgi:hypothetical protein